MEPKENRKYTQEFKTEAVNLVIEQGYSIAEAARNLGIDASTLGKWKNKAVTGGFSGSGNSKITQEELRCLRKENKRLKLEREILKKAVAFFAKESK